jgi:hypothetical protein
MSGQQRRWSGGLLLSLFLVAAGGARADQAAGYELSGATGAALWALGPAPLFGTPEAGATAVVFAFSRAAPVKAVSAAAPAPKEDPPPPGPRAAFMVTRWVLVNGDWVQQEWYGDWQLAAHELGIAADLAQGALDSTVMGTLVEHGESGTVVQRHVPGRLQVSWTGSSERANTTTAYTYQTPAYTAALQTVGSGRMAKATAILTVPALGGPIPLSGIGTLSSITTGALNVAMQ